MRCRAFGGTDEPDGAPDGIATVDDGVLVVGADDVPEAGAVRGVGVTDERAGCEEPPALHADTVSSTIAAKISRRI